MPHVRQFDGKKENKMMTMTLGHFVTLTSYNRPTQAKLPDSLLRLNIPGMMLFVYGQELYS